MLPLHESRHVHSPPLCIALVRQSKLINVVTRDVGGAKVAPIPPPQVKLKKFHQHFCHHLHRAVSVVSVVSAVSRYLPAQPSTSLRDVNISERLLLKQLRSRSKKYCVSSYEQDIL